MKKVAVFLVTLTVFAQAVSAAEGGHHAAPQMDFLFFASVFNFTLFVGLIYMLLRKPMGVFLRRRKLELEELINKVRVQQEELARQKQELAEALAALTSQKDEMLAAAKKSAELEKAKILADAQIQAEHLIKDAGIRAEQMLGQVAQKAKQEFVDALLTEAAAHIPDAMNPTVDTLYADQVAERFVASMAGEN